MGCFVLCYTSRVICKGQMTMEEIIFSLKHSWRFVDSAALELQGLSWGTERNIAGIQNELIGRKSQAPMIRIEFSEQEKRALDYERYHHPHPHVQRKMEALWLKSQKLPHKDICRFTGISKHTLCTYLQAYKQGGLEKLKKIKFYKPKIA